MWGLNLNKYGNDIFLSVLHFVSNLRTEEKCPSVELPTQNDSGDTSFNIINPMVVFLCYTIFLIFGWAVKG